MSGKGSNSAHFRGYNERVVLEILQRFGTASKADVAKRTNLTPQAVAIIVDGLAEVGLVERRGRRMGQIGQPSILYGPAAAGAYAIGLHIGRRALEAVLVDFAGAVRRFESTEYEYPEPHTVARLAASYAKALKADLTPAARERVVGIGVATPYFLSAWATELEFPSHVKDAWQAIDLREMLSLAIGQPLRFENDASAAATAELLYGRGREYRNWIYLSINTFIGGGLIIDGSIEVGPNGNSAAYGPYPVSPSRLTSVVPPTRSFDILLHRASAYVLINHLRANGVTINRVNDLEALGTDAEPFLTEWIEDAADALAQAIVGSIAIIDVEAVVIDAILPRAVLERMIAQIQRCFSAMLPEGLIAPAIVIGTIGRQAAAIGGAILPLYAMFAPTRDVQAKGYEPPASSTVLSAWWAQRSGHS